MYTNSSVVDRNDLIQAGMLGLLNGLKSYNPIKSKGAKKETYILNCIRREMMDEANKFYGPFKIPHEKKLLLNKFIKLFNKKSSKKDIKKILELSDKEYGELLHLSKNNNVQQLDNLNLITLPSFTDDIDSILNSFHIKEYEKQLIKLRLDGHTYKYIGFVLGFHAETVKQQYNKLLNKIKSIINKRIQNGK